MTETTYATREEYVDEPHVGRTVFIVGILLAIAAIALFELTVLGYSMDWLRYDSLEASYATGLLAIPLLIFSFAWGVRRMSAAFLFATFGFLVAALGVILFVLYYPAQVNVFQEPGAADQTVLVANVYLLGILMLLVSIGIGIGVRDHRVRTFVDRLQEPSTSTPGTPFAAAMAAASLGDTIPIGQVPGVGRTHAKRLRTVGIRDSGQLLQWKPGQLSGMTGVHEDRIEEWRCLADLIRVRGIGPRFAGALYRSGVTSVDGLAEETSESLMARVESSPTAKRGRRMRVDRARALKWIEEARILGSVPDQASVSAASAPPPAAAAAQ